MKTLMQPVHMPVQEFGACLKLILESKRISASELARMMAYKSRNSIFRILDEEGGHGVRQAFYERLMQEDPLQLTDEERRMLGQAFEVSRVGKRAFLRNCAMRELLMNVAAEDGGSRVRIDARENRKDPDFHQALADMAHGKKAHLTIVGCCERAIFEALRERICKTDTTCEVKITHFIYTGDEEIVHNISAIQPLLYSDFYTAYCVKQGVFSKERETLYRQNCIHIHMQDANGTWYGQPLMLVDKGVFMPLKRARVDEKDPLTRLYAEDIQRMTLLKTEFSAGAEMKDYLAYIRDCRTLEMNRAIYTIKPDVPLHFIHPDILLPCLTDSFREMAEKQSQEMIGELVRVHLERWENIFSKGKISHTVFAKEAMEQFARTGRQLDHFFASRPYTGDERVRILSHIRTQAQNNPNFRIHFFKEGCVPTTTEIGLYEGAGTLMSKPMTHYDLAGDHAEAIITQKEFCEGYKSFFVQDLLERCVVTQEETLQYMDALIEIAREA